MNKGFWMLTNNYNQQSASTFDFKMTTSSGDKIDLSTYKSSQLEIEQYEDNNLKTTSISLRETYGYSFSYVGDGIDKQDQKEIDEALKNIKPLLDFLQPNSDLKATDKNISDKAMDINALLPKAKDENHQNFIKDSLLDEMDKMLKAFEDTDKMTKLATYVFDELEKQMKGLSLYA